MRRFEPPQLSECLPDASASYEREVVKFEVVPCPACAERWRQRRALEGRQPPKEALEDVRTFAWWLQASIPEGARFRLPESSWRKMSKAYEGPFASLLGATAYDTLMGNLVGSSWGAWTVEKHFSSGDLLIGRHEPGDVRVYEAPDRRDRYVILPNGEHWLKGEWPRWLRVPGFDV